LTLKTQTMQLLPFRPKRKLKSDEKLLEEYLHSRDFELLGELYARYMPLVYGLCLKYLKEREAAKDTVILLFEKLVVEVDRHEIHNFKSWLHTVAKNHCLMGLRKAKSEKEIYLNSEKELDQIVENMNDLHPIDEEEHKRNNEALENCIEKLKDEQRNCIRLFYFENKSYREISLLLELEEKRVKSFIQNGKRNLKICLDRKHETIE